MTSLSHLWRKRWLRFLLVGGLNTAASYAVYAALLAAGLSYPLANLGGLLFGILFSFHTHSAYVFKRGGAWRFPRFLAAWAALYGVNIMLIGGFTHLGIDAYRAGALAIPPMALLSYLAQKMLVFGERA